MESLINLRTDMGIVKYHLDNMRNDVDDLMTFKTVYRPDILDNKSHIILLFERLNIMQQSLDNVITWIDAIKDLQKEVQNLRNEIKNLKTK